MEHNILKCTGCGSPILLLVLSVVLPLPSAFAIPVILLWASLEKAIVFQTTGLLLLTPGNSQAIPPKTQTSKYRQTALVWIPATFPTIAPVTLLLALPEICCSEAMQLMKATALVMPLLMWAIGTSRFPPQAIALFLKIIFLVLMHTMGHCFLQLDFTLAGT